MLINLCHPLLSAIFCNVWNSQAAIELGFGGGQPNSAQSVGINNLTVEDNTVDGALYVSGDGAQVQGNTIIDSIQDPGQSYYSLWINSPVLDFSQISGNTMISGPTDVPASIISAAGLEPAYQGLLMWAQVPPPPVP